MNEAIGVMDSHRTRNQWAIFFAMVFPSLLTWIYFVALGDNSGSAQQLAYAIGKAVQFGFPVFWFVCVQRCKLKLRIPSTDGLALGMGFGLLVVGAMFLFYQLVLLRLGLFDEARLQIQEKVSSFGIGSVGAFVGLAIFYSVCHSFLEEYYWRWFVFGQLRRTRSFLFAALVSSLGFMAHHVIVLAVYFGWWSPLTYLLAASVAVGGFVWAWLYERTNSLAAPWISHLIVDAGIFLLGFNVIRSTL